jgi:hypothetical protein
LTTLQVADELGLRPAAVRQLRRGKTPRPVKPPPPVAERRQPSEADLIATIRAKAMTGHVESLNYMLKHYDKVRRERP